MKLYAYERIRGINLMRVRFDGHRELINQYAAKGYRFVGMIPAEESGYGAILAMDLVFERDTDEEPPRPAPVSWKDDDGNEDR